MKKLLEGFAISKEGHLTIGGCDAVSLAKQYGTPLYVMDEDVLRNNCRKFKQSIDQYYDGRGLVLYASKAFSCKEIYRLAKAEGIGVDVVSGGELYTALSAGFPAEKIYFHGNNKTPEEIRYALQSGVQRIVADNTDELNRVNDIAGKMGVCANVQLRIKPGIDAHTHDFVRTGQIDSKFGFALETGEAMAAVLETVKLPHIQLKGMHCHIGSQIFDIDPFELAAEVMMKLIKDIFDQTGLVIEELNLGGGFGIRYTDEDQPVEYGEYMRVVSAKVKELAQEFGLPVPFILIEPGRSIAGPAGSTLYTVGALKEIPNIRHYVSMDGGMTDNPRYALYQSKYDVIIANKANEPADYMATVAGKCCESGDLIGENMMMQKPESGDILAVFATGAYNYSMASNYNRNPRAAVVFAMKGKSWLVVKRESYEDIIRNDI